MCLCKSAWADLFVRFDPADTTVEVGNSIDINIVADIGDPILGWGLDLSYDDTIITQLGNPTIGPLWQPTSAPDGDNLAALAFPDSVSGNDVTLATIKVWTKALGQSDLTLGITPGDNTEGFPLDPTGFAQATFITGHITVTPEPAGILMLLTSGLILLGKRRL
jgi:hypothetical protein